MADTRQLLVDALPFEVSPQQIKESEQQNSNLYVQGVVQRANILNKNNRIYPKNVLEKVIDKYYEENISQQRALGELDHPDSPVVNLSNASHNVIETWWNGNELMGKIEILSTPSGNILKELLKSGVKVGISSRGLGSVKQTDGGLMVEDDYKLVAFDFVSNPSTHGAFQDIVKENNIEGEYDYTKINKIISEIIEINNSYKIN